MGLGLCGFDLLSEECRDAAIVGRRPTALFAVKGVFDSGKMAYCVLTKLPPIIQVSNQAASQSRLGFVVVLY
jgi:hypothetical protein